jgi:hypothetical protein
MFVVTTSVVSALLGDRQVTPSKEAESPVPKQALKPLMVRVMADAMTREQRLKSLLQT